jgi:hypothetical protein
LKAIEKRQEEAKVVLQHLEMHLMHMACDDPGSLIGLQLALPILQERLDAKALEYAGEKAKMAESEIIMMEVSLCGGWNYDSSVKSLSNGAAAVLNQ